jgi:N6-adenosine-specific RNA methylase IME4
MKKYKTILIDPPWDVNFGSCASGNSKRVQYQTMSLQEIQRLPIAELAETECNLFCWTTHTYLPHTFDLLKAWGFIYNGVITWNKGNGLVHFGLHRSTEFCLHAFKAQKDIRADGRALPGLIGDIPDLFSEPRTVHSRKPVTLYRILETKTAEPRLEMFARAKRAGWDSWGNEVTCDVNIETVASISKEKQMSN